MLFERKGNQGEGSTSGGRDRISWGFPGGASGGIFGGGGIPGGEFGEGRAYLFLLIAMLWYFDKFRKTLSFN